MSQEGSSSHGSVNQPPQAEVPEQPDLRQLIAQQTAMMAEVLQQLRLGGGHRPPDQPLPAAEVEPPMAQRAPGPRRRAPNPAQREEEGYSERSEESEAYERPRRPRRAARERDYIDDDSGNIKTEIPNFTGRNNAEVYLEWERRTEMAFECHRYSEGKKVKLATARFTDYALVWWDQLVVSRRRNGEEPIVTWPQLKAIMRRRFVPNHYHREVHHRLRRLTQGSMSVEEYFKELEMLKIRANVEEDREAAMERFIGGLNEDIQERVENQHYVDMDDLLHIAIRCEQRLKRKGKARYSSRIEQPKVEEPIAQPKPESSKPRQQVTVETSKPRNRDIKCFKCHGTGHYARDCGNKHAMIILASGEVETDKEEEEVAEKIDEDSSTEYEEVLPEKGSLLLMRRAMVLPDDADEESECEDKHSVKAQEAPQQPELKSEPHAKCLGSEGMPSVRCLIGGKEYIVEFDESKCDVAILREKLSLIQPDHQNLFVLQAIDDGNGAKSGESKVVEASFALDEESSQDSALRSKPFKEGGNDAIQEPGSHFPDLAEPGTCFHASGTGTTPVPPYLDTGQAGSMPARGGMTPRPPWSMPGPDQAMSGLDRTPDPRTRDHTRSVRGPGLGLSVEPFDPGPQAMGPLGTTMGPSGTIAGPIPHQPEPARTGPRQLQAHHGPYHAEDLPKAPDKCPTPGPRGQPLGPPDPDPKMTPGPPHGEPSQPVPSQSRPTAGPCSLDGPRRVYDVF